MKPLQLSAIWAIDALTFTMLPCTAGKDCWAKWILVLLIGFAGGFLLGCSKARSGKGLFKGKENVHVRSSDL
jgi:hypothetical protein